MFRQLQPTSSVSKTLRCSSKYSLGQSQSSSWGSTSSTITETDLLKYEDLNMDLKELSALFKDLNKKKTQKNSNLRKLSKKKNSTQANRNSIARRYKEEENKFAKNIKKILSEKIREKALQRLDRLINNPKEERLNKVACTLAALIDILKSCGVSGGPASNEDLIKRYKDKISKEYPAGFDAATEFLIDILEKKDISLKDFIGKQSTHSKRLGEILKATIKELPNCSA
jgi:hypothetical protein